MSTPTTFAEAEAVLAEKLPGYESRPQQVALAQAVTDALATKTNFLGQAGTGTGKSLGYLIPAILAGKRIIVTTATKALQDQIANKDLPFLKEHLGVDFTYAVLKGRTNYACLAKTFGEDAADLDGINDILDVVWEDPLTSPTGLEVTDAQLIDQHTFSGERNDFGFEIPDATWRAVSSSADECPGKKDCIYGGCCYSERAKTKAKNAHVVVVNHALFFTDLIVALKTEGLVSLLGDYDVVIADEAHELENYATNAFGSRFTEFTLRQLLNEIATWARKYNQTDVIDGESALVSKANIRFWNHLPDEGRLRLRDIVESQDVFVEVLDALRALLHAMERTECADRSGLARRRILLKRLDNLLDRFTDIVVADEDVVVRWVEKEWMSRTRENRKVLNAAPISVASILRSEWTSKQIIGVSATLPFSYTAERLGIDEYRSLDVGTPFDYPNQALLYVPEHLVEPTQKNRAQWQTQAIDEIEWLLTESSGRALVLFTSNADLKAAFDDISRRGLPYEIRRQGNGVSNKALAEWFNEETDSVLFATRSFMTGVDFQGDTCSLVVISKLPFPVPSDPIVEARCEALKRQGINDFANFTVPEMTLPLQQGFGRLIRNRRDRGVVAILDPRLQTKSYGKGIVKNLPDARFVSTRDEVTNFFDAAEESDMR